MDERIELVEEIWEHAFSGSEILPEYIDYLLCFLVSGALSHYKLWNILFVCSNVGFL